MLDFASVEKYKENNRIEAKKALGGLPRSIWETYSSFANTLGGVILLGVEEYRDKSFHTVDLPNPYGMVKEFLEGLNDKKRVNINILASNNVSVIKVNGNRIIVIEVPRASRFEKPVYINGDMIGGTYRRNGEGDYKCTPSEVEAMLRDASVVTADMKPVLRDDFAFNAGSVSRFRELLEVLRPGHSFLALNGWDFLQNIGAAVETESGKRYPTVAGALMFGAQKSITESFREFFLSRRIENIKGEMSFTDGRGGNMFDFYFDTARKVKENLCDIACDTEAVMGGILEALVNGLSNADYYLGGVSVSVCPEGAKITNAGGFRVKIEKAEKGEVSDPRNSGLAAMFNLIKVGKGIGTGISGIYSMWRSIGWSAPKISETFEPEKTSVELPFVKYEEGKCLFEDKPFFRYSVYREEIIYYLTKNIKAELSELSKYAGAEESETAEILSEMLESGTVSEEICDGKTRYKLRD